MDAYLDTYPSRWWSRRTGTALAGASRSRSMRTWCSRRMTAHSSFRRFAMGRDFPIRPWRSTNWGSSGPSAFCSPVTPSDGLTAARIGLVVESFPERELDGAVDSLARRMANVAPRVAGAKQVRHQPVGRTDGAGPTTKLRGRGQRHRAPEPWCRRMESCVAREGTARGDQMARRADRVTTSEGTQ